MTEQITVQSSNREVNTDFTKTLQIQLLPPTEKKKQYLDRCMDQFCTVANVAAKRAPSIGYRFVKNPTAKGNPVAGWVKELRKRDEISLDYQCTSEAIHKALEAYHSIQKNGEYDKVPRLENNDVIRLHGRDNLDIEYDEDGERFYLVLRVVPYEKVRYPLKGRGWQYDYLAAIVNGDLRHGAAEIKRSDNSYILNLTYNPDPLKPYDDPETIIGIDLGINTIATTAGIKTDGEVVGKSVELWKGGQVKEWGRRYNNRKAEYHAKKLKAKNQQLYGKHARRIDTKMHEMSREIVDHIQRFEKPMIVFEDLTDDIRDDLMDSEGITGKERRTKNRMLSGWRYGDLRDKITYKAREQGIPVETVDPFETSKRCNKCGNKGIRPYEANWSRFYCPHCDYEVNADVNAAINIAERAI